MDAFHNLLREATNPRNAGSTNSAMPTPQSLTQALQNAGGGHVLGMPPSQLVGANGNNTMGLPMGISMPLSMPGLQPGGTKGLAPIHGGRINSLMVANSPIFPSLGGTGTPTSMIAPVCSAGSSTTPVGAVSSAERKKTITKKRKAPSADADSGEDGRKQPEEYDDPKAKRRAQIAKAARKHRQRQKDELIALRAKVKDLKEQIEVLQSSEPSEHNTELGWKQEAEQHAEIRARVDQENEFLRKTLMEQMRFIQRLQDYFTKQPLLNMPSLDMILNSSSASTAPAALSNSISSVSPVLQLQSGSFRDRLITMATEALSNIDKQLTACEAAFRNPTTSTMTYFGLQVQYEMGKNEMGIFFRHHLYGCNPSTIMNDLWSVLGDASFEKSFAFTDVVEILEELDMNTKYIRRVVNLTMSSDATVGGGMMKEESLTINQKRDHPDGSWTMVMRSILDDPSHPKSTDLLRRNTTTAVSLKNYSDSTGQGCLLLWSVKVELDKQSDERAKSFNIPDIILKNLFEVAPVFVKGIVDRARGTLQS
ncbi:uncharacterized protein PHALS_05048 [Plasmopara halstedii]|uniref:BZIP domain-containing protein n=1 Tax=Plasmopara halstedii TaxID=4781 RepID=A0A0P1A9I3_PLAHL|nr:uncharacterized protein PHALS_05048 [Plasmopara halstedii]CEG37455.1 hypothetical protein PHALS_05048 [Plasmopara halstedii]|eukprot:XP_024573824.1 hypothetical protein PHALS_05048 [Plasmopara halstedii]